MRYQGPAASSQRAYTPITRDYALHHDNYKLGDPLYHCRCKYTYILYEYTYIYIHSIYMYRYTYIYIYIYVCICSFIPGGLLGSLGTQRPRQAEPSRAEPSLLALSGSTSSGCRRLRRRPRAQKAPGIPTKVQRLRGLEESKMPLYPTMNERDST